MPVEKQRRLTPDGARVARLERIARSRRRHRRRKVERPSFWRQAPGAFAYPFNPNGLVAWLMGTLLLLLGYSLLVLIHRERYGISLIPFAVVIGVGCIGYMTRYVMDVIGFTGSGSDEPPGWPDLEEYDRTALYPFAYTVAIAAVSWGLYVLAYGAGVRFEVRIGLLALGQAYLPMALLCVAVSERFSNLNPARVLKAICRVPTRYVLPCALFVLMTVPGAVWLEEADLTLSREAIFHMVVVSVVALYFLLVIFRLVGLIYYTAEDRFTWLG